MVGARSMHGIMHLSARPIGRVKPTTVRYPCLHSHLNSSTMQMQSVCGMTRGLERAELDGICERPQWETDESWKS